MYKERVHQDWERIIKEIVEKRSRTIKEEVIEASEFLSLITNDFEEGKDLDEIEKYYRNKEIYPNVIEPKLMHVLSGGSGGGTSTRREEYVKNWINEEMLDKARWKFAWDIDENFISEICKEENYKEDRIVRKRKEEVKKSEDVLVHIQEAIDKIKKIRGIGDKDLILIIELNHSAKLELNSANYRKLEEKLGKIIIRHPLPNNFQFALVDKNELIFHWIFWGLKWNYNIFNLGTYILLHVWYRSRLKDKESYSGFSFLLEE
jgi:hypothetical protein